MGRQLAAKREQLKELQRAGRRPKVKSVKGKDVVAALTQLRDLLQGNVGVAAQVLKAFAGDVILETRQVERKAKPLVRQTTPVRAAIETILLAWSVSEHDEWRNQVVFLPF